MLSPLASVGGSVRQNSRRRDRDKGLLPAGLCLEPASVCLLLWASENSPRGVGIAFLSILFSEYLHNRPNRSDEGDNRVSRNVCIDVFVGFQLMLDSK